MNEKPVKDDSFILKKLYRFIPTYSKAIKVMIELEIYHPNICVVSFYHHKKGTDKNKYKIRIKIGAGQVKSIMKACLAAYDLLEGDYAFVFNASNDIGEFIEDNARYSAYKLFLETNFNNYNDYIQYGTMSINTLMLYHQSFQYKEEADIFYKQYEGKMQKEALNKKTHICINSVQKK